MAIRIATNIPSLPGVTPYLGGVMRLATGKMFDDPVTPTALVNNPGCTATDGSHVDYILDTPMVFLTPGDPFYDITPRVIIDDTEFTEVDIKTIHSTGGFIRSTFNQQQNKFIATAHHGTQALSLLLDGGSTMVENIINNAGGTSVGINSFIQLIDAPSTYTGQAGKVVAVNTSEDGVEFITPSSGSDSPFIETGTNSAALKDSTIFNTTLINSVMIGEICRGINNNSLILGNTQGNNGWNEQFSISTLTVSGIGFPTPSPLANFLLPSGYYVAFECMVSGVNSTDSYHQKVTGYARNNSGTITLDYDVVDVKSESATMVITMSTTATGLRIIGTINVIGGAYRATTFMNLNYGLFGL